jgi:hypothetical protein
MGEKMNVYRTLVGKLEGKTPLERPRYRFVDNIKIDLNEIRWGGMDWICLVQGRDQWRALVNTVMNLGFHKMLGNLVAHWLLLKKQQHKRSPSSLCLYPSPNYT